jgi:hypothetical protein
MGDFAHGVGLAIPPGLPQITLKEFGLRFGGRRKLLRAWGRADWQPAPGSSAPWLQGGVQTVVDIGSSINAQTTRRELDLELSWVHTVDGRSFQATASHQHQGNRVSVEWDGGSDGNDASNATPGSASRLGLVELHRALALDAVFALPDMAALAIFEFSSLRLDFSSDPRLLQLQATSDLGRGTLQLDATFGKGQTLMSAAWVGNTTTDTLGLGDLLDAVDQATGLALPDGLGQGLFDFHSLTLSYINTSAAGMPQVQALHFVGDGGESFCQSVFLSVLKSPATTRSFVVGVAFKPHTDLGQLAWVRAVPWLGAVVSQVQAMLSIEPAYLLYASEAVKNYIPPTPELASAWAQAATPGRAPTLGRGIGLGGTASAGQGPGLGRYTLGQGATVAARMVFSGSKNPVLGLIGDLIGLDALDAQVTVGQGLALRASIPGQLALPGAAGQQLSLSDAFFGLGVTAGGVPTFQIGGSAHFNLFGNPREVQAQLEVDETAAAAMLHLTDLKLPSIHPLPGLQFKDDFWLELGLQFTPPGLDIGFMGDFFIGDEANTGKVVMVMELVEGVPNPLYARFSIAKLTVWDMFEAMTGLGARMDEAESALHVLDASGVAQATGLGGVTQDAGRALSFLKQQYKNLKPIFDGVSLNDVAFHWAESAVMLPDGSHASPGVGFRGRLDLFGWDLFAAFEFSSCSPTKLTAHLEMEPIKLGGMLTVSGDGKGVTRAEAQGQAEAWQAWEADQKQKPGERRAPSGLLKPTPAALDYVVQPGGPVLIVSSEHAPYLHASVHVALFDLLHLDLMATVDDNGMAFQLVTGIGSFVTVDLGCSLRIKDGFRFEAYGKLGLHLNVDLGLFELNAGLDGEIHLIVTDGSFKLVIDGTFVFQGAELHLPTLTLDVPIPSLGDLPAKVAQQIKDQAAHIFGDIFGALGEVATKAYEGVKAVGEEVAKGAEELGKEVAADAKIIGAAVGQGLSLLAGGAEQALNEASHALVEVEQKTEAFVNDIKDKTEQAAKDLAHDAEQVVALAEHTFNVVADEVTADVKKVEGEIVDIVCAAEHKVEEIAEAIAPVVQGILNTASEVAHDIEAVAETVAHGLEDLAGSILGEAEALAHTLEDAAQAVGHAFEDLGEKLNPFNW